MQIKAPKIPTPYVSNFIFLFMFCCIFVFIVVYVFGIVIYIYINKITKALVGVEVGQGLLGGIVALEDASSFQDSSRRKKWERNKV